MRKTHTASVMISQFLSFLVFPGGGGGGGVRPKACGPPRPGLTARGMESMFELPSSCNSKFQPPKNYIQESLEIRIGMFRVEVIPHHGLFVSEEMSPVQVCNAKSAKVTLPV